MSEFYVFGYGSLMWRPGFEHLGAEPAMIVGRHRRLCVYSWWHRGSQERPGLVLGLDRGGACRGIAFAVAPGEREAVIAYLRAREQVTNVYLETSVRARLPGGRVVDALTYVVDRTHPQYAGLLPPPEIVEIVRDATGRSGHNADYVTATADHLEELGIADRTLRTVAAALRRPPEAAAAE
jgi:cation transport protein ChaC